jgi:hypothetical protein
MGKEAESYLVNYLQEEVDKLISDSKHSDNDESIVLKA